MAEKFDFKLFKNVGTRRGTYTISLTKDCAFGFNSGFYQQENVKDYKYVKLSFDENKKAVGFQFTNNKNENGIWKITHGKNSATVVARSFFNAFFIDPADYSGKYKPDTYKDSKLGKLFYIILKK